MPEEKKSFFNNLEPKSALIVGLVTGILSLGTLGFIILGIITLKGGLPQGAGSGAQVAYQQPTDVAPNDVAPVQQAPKSDKPKVELFVMSHCPYGVQTQKAYIPAMELLKNKADMDVKFVSYLMHGQIEKDDNNIEHCIQKEQNDKFIPFLKCFTASGDSASCLTTSGVDKNKLNSCIAAIDKQFAINAEFNNQANWLSGQFPLYNVHKDLNDKYGVQGSPTLVINGAQIDAPRSPEGIKQAICGAFNNPPAECGQTLSTQQAAPGFGTQVGGNAPANAGCGTT